MPKNKTHKGASKRFVLGKDGRIRRRKAFGNHLLGKKASTRKRRLNAMDEVSEADEKRIRKMLKA